MNVGTDDPFKSVYDKHNCFREYYALKRKLLLTKEEYERLTYDGCGDNRTDKSLSGGSEGNKTTVRNNRKDAEI